MNTKKQIVLCPSGMTHNCPTVQIEDSKVTVKDDFGGKVEIPAAAWNVLIEKVRSGELKALN